MRRNYFPKNFLFISMAALIIFAASCSKEKKTVVNVISPPVTATPTQLGLYEVDSSIYKLLLIGVSKIGTQTVNYDFIFDTGSGGMVIDAAGILPASMITSTGFTFTGDSTIVDGITITNQTSEVDYGDDAATTDKVFGNLAYAPVTVGDANGNFVVKRLPFFIYYKAVDGKGVKFDPHEFDTFGVSEEYDISFPNGSFITSPFKAFDPGTGLTHGFKMAALGTSQFSQEGNYVEVLTLGLTADDLSSTSGFSLSQLTFDAQDGYAPIIPATITYSGNTVTSDVLFDTGTEPYSFIEDKKATNTSALLLPASTPVTLATTSGFNYNYTTTPTENLTNLENPSSSGVDVSILSLEFFINNEYLLDYDHHKLGLKGN